MVQVKGWVRFCGVMGSLLKKRKVSKQKGSHLAHTSNTKERAQELISSNLSSPHNTSQAQISIRIGERGKGKERKEREREGEEDDG